MQLACSRAQIHGRFRVRSCCICADRPHEALSLPPLVLLRTPAVPHLPVSCRRRRDHSRLLLPRLKAAGRCEAPPPMLLFLRLCLCSAPHKLLCLRCAVLLVRLLDVLDHPLLLLNDPVCCTRPCKAHGQVLPGLPAHSHRQGDGGREGECVGTHACVGVQAAAGCSAATQGGTEQINLCVLLTCRVAGRTGYS